MSEESAPNTPAARPLTRRQKLGIITGAMILGAVWLLWGTSPALPRDVLHAQRSANGAFEEQGPRPPVVAELQASYKKSQTNSLLGQMSSGTEFDRVPCRSLAILCESDHPLVGRIALEVYRGFQKDTPFQEITLVPFGKSLPAGELLPDIYLSLDLSRIDEFGLAGSRSLDAKVNVFFGTQLSASNHHVSSEVDPPIYYIAMNCHWEYFASQLGLETGSARYNVMSKELAQGIVDSLRKSLQTLIDQQGAAPETPPEFLPDYHPLPDLPFLKEIGATQILAGRQFMTSHKSLWRFESARPVAELKQIVADGMAAAGWLEIKRDDSEEPWMRLTSPQENWSAELYRPDPESTPIAEEPPDSKRVYYLAITKSMSKEAAKQALIALLQGNPSEAQVLRFADFWFLAPEHFDSYFGSRPSRSPDALVQMARQELRQKTPDMPRVQQLLRRAWTLEEIRDSNGKSKHDFKKLFQDAELGEAPAMFDVSVLQPEDIVDVRGDLPAPIELAVNERLLMLAAATDRRTDLIELTIQPKEPKSQTLALQWRHVHFHDGNTHSMTYPRRFHAAPPYQLSFPHTARGLELEIRPLDESGKYELTLKRE